MKLRNYQVKLVSQCKDVLDKYHLCYLAAEERVGKTLPALELALNYISNDLQVLIVTKKKVINSWIDTINIYVPEYKRKDFIITNFENIKNLENNKNFKQSKLFFVIIDEAHHILSAYPTPSKICILLQKIVYEVPYMLLLSATSHGETASQLFHQLNLSKYSPFDSFKNFKEWFSYFGIPTTQWIGNRFINKYNKCKEKEVMQFVSPYFVTMSRKEAGFLYEPEDAIIYINVNEKLKKIYSTLENNKCLKKLQYEANTKAKLITALHQLEGGTLKLNDKVSIDIYKYYNINIIPDKINYILQEYGDNGNIAIFYNYIYEGVLLNNYFKKALILQGTSYAEGIDLKHIKHLIIYSQNFSACKYIQRRARQAGAERKELIQVKFLLCKGYISEMIYNCVAKKNKNFTSSFYINYKDAI